MHEPARPAPSSPLPLADYPDALVDRLEVGCRIFLPGYSGDILSLRRRLEATVAREGTGSFARFHTLFTSDDATGSMELTGGLRLASAEGGGVCTTGKSSVEMNLIRFLREARCPDAPPGLDGGLNFVEVPGASRGELLALQLSAVAQSLDDLVSTIEDAAGCPATARFSLRQVEINRDIPVADARRLAHGLVHTPSPWYRSSEARHYASAPDISLDGNDVTVTWVADAEDLPTRFKFYAKRPDRLRVEVCFDNAGAAAAALSGRRRVRANPSAGDGPGLARLLRSLVAECVSDLDAMEAHAAAVSQPQAGVLVLLAALAPLLRVTAPPPAGRAGRRPGEATMRDANDAIYHLLTLGRFDASELRTGSTVREALRRIAREGGLLDESRGRAALFTVPPRMHAGRCALARSFWPSTVGGQGGGAEDGDE